MAGLSARRTYSRSLWCIYIRPVLSALRRRRETLRWRDRMRFPAREARNLAPGRFSGFGSEPINAAMGRRKVSVPRGHLRRLRKLVFGRKVHEHLRTVFRRVDRKIRQGRLASAQRFSALHSLNLRDGKRTGPPGVGERIRGAELCLTPQRETDGRGST